MAKEKNFWIMLYFSLPKIIHLSHPKEVCEIFPVENQMWTSGTFSLRTCSYVLTCTQRAHKHAHMPEILWSAACFSLSQDSHVPSACLPSVLKAFTRICQPAELRGKVTKSAQIRMTQVFVQNKPAKIFFPLPLPDTPCKLFLSFTCCSFLSADSSDHLHQDLVFSGLIPGNSPWLNAIDSVAPSMVLSTTKRAQCINVHF